MIDVHSHILPGIDDGARSIEETCKMLRESYVAGFRTVISTSHYLEGKYISNKQQKEKYIQLLQNILIKEKIDIKVCNGTEVYSNINMLSLIKDGTIATLNNSRYVLIELPMNQNNIFFKQMIYDLVSMGYIPIIAHPERYIYVQNNPNIVFDWLEQGSLLQANYGSFIGMYGRKAQKTVIKLLKHNAIHFLGTDCHRAESIYLKINLIREKIEKEVGKEGFYNISYRNPRHIIENKILKI